MSDSTPYLDAKGIRRGRAIGPQRHTFTEVELTFLGILADLGEPGTPKRQGWINLLIVHGFPAVVRATGRCFYLVGETGLVSSDQAMAVLDGLLPNGLAVTRHGTYPRRSAVA